MNENEIRELAYKLWEQADHPEGRDVEFWLEAKYQLATSKFVGRWIPLEIKNMQPANGK